MCQFNAFEYSMNTNICENETYPQQFWAIVAYYLGSPAL